MTNDEKRFTAEGAVDKAKKKVRQVRVQAPKARHAAEDRLQGNGDLPVVRTGPCSARTGTPLPYSA